MAELSLKVGDSFVSDASYTDDSGNAVDLVASGIVITSAVRSQDGLSIFQLTVTLADQALSPGGYEISGDTSKWTPGICAWDVRYSQGSYSWSNRTVLIDVKARIA